MTVSLAPLSEEDCLKVLPWRNAVRNTLRTSQFLTYSMQEAFYRDVVCDRRSPHRYYGLRHGGVLVGMGGLTNIQWENGLAEISLIVDPRHSGQGYGTAAVSELLSEGFDRMGLRTICGEAYFCNPGVAFWMKMVEKYQGEAVTIPGRKLWDGMLWRALLFSFVRPGERLAPDDAPTR